jgi:ArsR family transcriptional regulator, lead/cadmium/zinc/bismuth-responsive transcriptional repressor
MGKKDKKKKRRDEDEAKPLAKPPAKPQGGSTAPVRADAARPKLRARRRPAGADRFREAPKEIAVFDPENVERALDALPQGEVIARAADRMQGLAHPTRIQALLALSASELCVGDMAAILSLSLSATSTMLKQLRSLGFVATRHAGKQTYYRLASPIPKAILDPLLRLDEAA